MSYDFDIATHERPQREDIEEVLPRGVELSGSLRVEEILNVSSCRWAFSIDGPVRCEPTDLSGPLAHAAIAPQWLTRVSVPIGDPNVARMLAAEIAKHLAQTRSGAAYDPQEDRVLYPRAGKRPSPPRPPRDTPTRLLKAEWCYRPNVLAAAGARFMSVVRMYLPEATPRRFGTFEPLQHRFEGDGEAFFDLWKSESESSGSLFWTCKTPGVGGGANWPYDNEANDALGGIPAAHLRVELQGDAVTSSEQGQWRAAVTAWFRAVSEQTGAFYGRAILAAPAPSEIPASEVENLLIPAAAWRGRWYGVPRHPAWLTWCSSQVSTLLPRPNHGAPSDSDPSARLWVQDANLELDSTVLPEGISDDLYRRQVGEGTCDRERLTRAGFRSPG